MLLKKITRGLLVSICVLIAVMWVYAFGFAPRESFNKINDTAWQARAQAHCKTAEDQRFSIEDLTPMKADDPAALATKAKLVETATDYLEKAINLIASDKPSDAKGQELVPEWIADYRIYIADRRAFIVALRNATTRPYFAETDIEGVPVSERISKFARENNMKTCQTPYDLSV
ncbi:MAG: hypothetical protein F2650_02780 [Actinobacteria bacterium]|uniref:Unannotated protein n=1 Tax=freshwater metagenome TaxID=449393 RepID=A0A6J6MBV3_9ZZZZ|nr:hypothetical protein [Actinomycetota bacterium]